MSLQTISIHYDPLRGSINDSLIFAELVPTSFTCANLSLWLIARPSLHQYDENSILIAFRAEIIANPKGTFGDFFLNNLSQVFERGNRGFCGGFGEVDGLTSHWVGELCTLPI